MSTKVYNKLVRDNIPEIIAETGKSCVTSTLSDNDYFSALNLKMSEELAEYQASHEVEELADLMEVIIAAAEALGSSYDELEAIRLRKKNKRGGFEKHIYLESVSDC